ncbi:hypothetical protein AMJ85_09370, partial [candidate division BRC1 bacterium SM23_51]
MLTSSVICLRRDGDGWTAWTIYEMTRQILAMTEKPTIGIGNVHVGHPGNEVVAGSWWHAVVIYGSADSWNVETLLDIAGMTGTLWGARAGDYDPTVPGEEVFVIAETVLDASLGYVFSRAGTNWTSRTVYSAEVAMDSAAGEFDPQHDGPEVVLPTEMG